MKKMNNEDKLEEFFNSRFSEDIPQESWNTPDSDVWDNISRELEEQPKKRGILTILPWFLMGLLAIFSIYLWNSYQDQNKRIANLEEHIENQGRLGENRSINEHEEEQTNESFKSINQANNDLKNNEKEVNLTSENAITFGQKLIENDIKIENLKKINLIPNETKKSQFQILNQVTPLSGSQIPASKLNFEIENINNFQNSEFSESFEISKNKGVLSDDFRTDLTDIVRSEMFDTSLIYSLLNFELNEEKALWVIQDPKQISPTPDRKKMYLTPTLNYYNWVDINRGSFDNPLSELLVDENTLSSLAYGLKGNVEIAQRFILNAGLLYTERNQESTYELKLPYSKDAEVVDANGEFVNSFEHSLPTGLGNVTTNLILVRSQSAELQENEIVELDFSFRQKSQALIVPIQMSYFPFQRTSGMFVEFGVLNFITLSNEVTKVSSMSHHSEVKEKSVSVSRENGLSSMWTVQAIGGIGYKRPIGRKVELVMLATYGHGLNSVFRTESYSHNINSLGIGIGVMRELGR